MDVMSCTQIKKNLAAVIDRVNDNHTAVIIARPNGHKAVLLGFDDYLSFKESAYLMANPHNAQRINQAIDEIESGLAQQHELVDA